MKRFGSALPSAPRMWKALIEKDLTERQGEMSSYKDSKSFIQRSKESITILSRYPGRVPIIVERVQKSHVPEIDKNKFLCPDTLTVGQFMYVIRRRMSLPPETALFLFVGNTLPMASSFMKELYSQHRDSDGFLYMQYAGESTFG